MRKRIRIVMGAVALALAAQAASAAIETTDFAMLDREQLLAEDDRAPAGTPLRVAIEYPVGQRTPDSVQRDKDGSYRWKHRYHVAGATDLSFGFHNFELPAGVSVYVYDEARQLVRGPYTSANNKPHRELWTPVVPGDTAIVEVVVDAPLDENAAKGMIPFKAAVTAPPFDIVQVNAGYRDMFGLEGKPILQRGGAAPCNIDVICPQGDDWRDEIRSVARYTIVNGGVFLCTGSLIADEPGTLRNLFINADHCGPNLSNDQTMIFYWNFESPTCGQLGGGSLTQAQSGAIWRAGNVLNDFNLVELEDEPLASWNVFYTGWDRSGANPVQTVGIHHPGGNEKMISLNTSGGTFSQNFCIAGTNAPNGFLWMNWETGITEPGSSGSGVWRTDNNKLVGTLSGGSSSCANPNGTDCYGRLSSAWNFGGTSTSRARDWLDPDNTGVTMADGIDPNVGICGDSVLAGAEQCDDGNTNPGDGCSATCDVEPGFACTDPVSERGLRDGGFEDGTPNGEWTEFSINNGTPICTGPSCGGGIADAGTYFLWFGRAGNDGEVGFVEQTLIIPNDATTLGMKVVVPFCDSAADSLVATVDGVEIIRIDGDDPTYCGTFAYTPISGSVAAFADNGVHVLRIEAQQNAANGASTDFFVDTVTLDGSTGGSGSTSLCTELPETCLAEDFDSGLGAWTVFRTGANTAQWGTTDDGTCNSNPSTPDGNFTGGGGEAACADSDAAGPGQIDAYLCGPQVDLATAVAPVLSFDYSYQINGAPNANDLLAVLVGSAVPSAGTIGGYDTVYARTVDGGAEFNVPGFEQSLDLGAYVGQSVYTCFRYRADDDWYAQVDSFAVRATQCQGAPVDTDGDGILDGEDNCPLLFNPGQEDNDNDNLGDVCDPDDDNDGIDDGPDNCPLTANPNQEDNDNDNLGDVCDPDDDNDGIDDGPDNCPLTANPNQEDNDNDNLGDVCDPDDDNDGIDDGPDNCPLTANPNQEDNDNDNLGDVCDPDDDNDGVDDGPDNCPLTANPNQEDNDNDNLGDVCDPDDDNDGVLDDVDNCPLTANPNQEDADDDGIGDVCDFDDTDGDGVVDTADNCTLVQNADQRDTDSDNIGNICDPDIAPAVNDCAVNFLDLNAMKGAFFSNPASPTWNPDADFNGDNSVNFTDLSIAKAVFFGSPGPSGLPNACN